VMEMLWAVEFYRDALYHHEYGTLINSGSFTGTPGDTARKQVSVWLAEQGFGKPSVTYRLRDWTISRQRYWGAPIPIVYCPEHGQVPVPDDQLPVELPLDVEWLPTGQSPLKLHPTWSQTTCPICGGPATRDTDTMDTFVCSSWYHLRYLSPHFDQGPFDPKEYDYWMPVDTYTGGVEHATLHLMYTRFFHKALRDIGITRDDGPIGPMVQLRNQGQILGPDGQRMSKSRGNVIDPDEQVNTYGADVVRAYLMFGYQWSEGGPWSTENIQGVVRWLNRVWAVVPDEKSEVEGQKSEVNKQESGVGVQESEIGRLKSVVGGQRLAASGHGKSEVGGQKPAVAGQKSEIGGQKSALEKLDKLTSGKFDAFEKLRASILTPGKPKPKKQFWDDD